ncbi:deoxyribonuclease-2-beta-like [Parambassis ranga]|uniref:Deoxyribonuclease-2-alpha n=1 Tax=Parambassis ranga TaxID=210632 RepID=A0A6P7JFT4_9TELE|nr:deoxyribonuclease-2-beta-like [Parambassis ranga]
MWRFILTVSLFCWGAQGQVSCRDKNNGSVDWFILYKAPKPKQSPLTGLEYVYMDPSGRTDMKPSTPNYKPINHITGVLANTLRPIFSPIRQMSPNLGFISYSDQPPGSNADSEKFGHSKGVVIVDSDNTGIWLLHSTPQFPFRRNQEEFWPNSGTKNAQTFICVTFNYSSFADIGTHLQSIGAFPFEHDLPDHFHQLLKDAVKWTQVPPSNNFKTLTSSGGQSFHSIAKQQSEQVKDGDLYVTIAELVSSSLAVQTWGCQPYRAPSYCVSNRHKVFNVNSIKTGLGEWKPNHDHSKWCVAQDQNKNWTCIADVNRAVTQYERRGGALCIQHEKIKEYFLGFAGRNEDCTTTPLIMDLDPGCDTGLPTNTGKRGREESP